MSDQFTASMGGVVVKHDSGELTFDCYAGCGRGAHHLDIGIGAVQALREFFLHERDQELGRWRWPENTDYVVYRDDRPGGFRVMHEPTGDTYTYYWEAIKDNPEYTGPWDAARAYFAAHPVSKPWHDAKPGEVWEITYRSPRGSEVSNRVMTCVDDGGDISFFNEYRLHTIYYTGIESARRIWPEVDDDC